MLAGGKRRAWTSPTRSRHADPNCPKCNGTGVAGKRIQGSVEKVVSDVGDKRLEKRGDRGEVIQVDTEYTITDACNCKPPHQMTKREREERERRLSQ